MTTPDDHDEDRESDRSSDEGRTGPFGLDIGAHIGTLLDAIEESRKRAGRRGRGRDRDRDRYGPPRRPGDTRDIAIRSNFSIGTLGSDEEGRSDDGDDRSRTKRVRVDTDDYLTAIRWEDDTFVVTADLPGVEREDLSVGTTSDRERLVIRAGDEVVDRVPLPEPRPAVDAIEARYNNHVLEVRVAAEDAGAGADDGEGRSR